jgi:hypothetical protein
MARGRGTAAERIADFLLEGVADDELATELAGWMAGSSRFRAFVEEHRGKIRKKLRVAADAEMRRDVRAELRTAHLLLAGRAVEVSFEPYGSATGGPDFEVRVGSARMNLEVTRLRGHADDAHLAAQLLAKLRQLPPSAPNAVLIAIGLPTLAGIDLAAVVRLIRRRADGKDESYFLARGFTGTRDFYQRFLRLGGAYLFAESGIGSSRAALWTSGSARIPLAPRAARAVLSRLQGE